MQRTFKALLFAVILNSFVLSKAAAQSQRLTQVNSLPLPKGLEIKISTNDEPRCDSAGNMLFQAGSQDLISKLVRISPTGKLLARIDLTSVSGFENGAIDDFSDGPDNATYVLASKIKGSSVAHDESGKPSGTVFWFKSGLWLVLFDEDGVLLSSATLKLPTGGRAYAFATFSDGNIFVVGRTDSGKTFGGIFTRQGNLVRTVTIPDDLDRQERKGQYSGVARDGVRLRVAEDGNAYLITGRYFPRLSVFSRDGSLIATNPIELPEGVDDLWLEQFSRGKMASELISRDTQGTERIFAVFDASTGKMLNRFVASIWDNWLISYSADTDTFSFMPNGGSRIDSFRSAAR